MKYGRPTIPGPQKAAKDCQACDLVADKSKKVASRRPCERTLRASASATKREFSMAEFMGT